MAEQWVRVENPPADPLYSVATVNPAIKGVYIHSIAAVPGTVALQNFITLFNPVGSGKTLTLATVAISYSNTATAGSIDPLRGHRISAAPTGGTLIAAANIERFNTTQVNPVGVVRVGNPTATLGNAIFNSPAPIDNKSSDVHTVDIPPGAGPFVMAPGQGIAISKATGAVSVTWNITLVWAEI